MRIESVEVELDTKAVGDDGTIEGYGSIFGNRDSGGDIMVPGAFLDSLKSRPADQVAMLYHHNPERPVGVWSEIVEDAKGLRVKGRLLTDTTDGEDTYKKVKAGAMRGLSVGYRTLKDEIDRATNTRRLLKVDLWEVSLVTFPMNTRARVGNVKSDLPTEREFENWLERDAGLSRRDAQTIIAKGYRALLGARDAAGGDGLLASIRALTETFQS